MWARVVILVFLIAMLNPGYALAALDDAYSCPSGFEPVPSILAQIHGNNSCYDCPVGSALDPTLGICGSYSINSETGQFELGDACTVNPITGYLECESNVTPTIVSAQINSSQPYCLTGDDYSPYNPFDINCHNMPSDSQWECRPGPDIANNPFDIICDPVDPDPGEENPGSGGEAICYNESGGAIDCPQPENDCDICQVLLECSLGIDRLRISLTAQLDEIIDRLDEIAALLANGLGGQVNIESSCNPLPPDYGGGELSPVEGVPWCEAKQIISCPVLFESSQNFAYHLVETFKNKFPIDMITGETWPQPIDDSEATLDLFGESFDITFFFNALDKIKIPSLISFLVWSLVSL